MLPSGTSSLAGCGIYEPEDVVLNKVRTSVRDEVEDLNITHWLLLLIDHESTCHHDYNASLLVCRLRILGVDSMLDFLEWQVLELSTLD